MLVPVAAASMPGGQAGTINLQFATAHNAQLATQLLNEIYAAASAGTLNVQNAPSQPASGSSDLNLFAIGYQGGVPDTGPDAATVPMGYLGIIDAFDNHPATITGAPTQVSESVFSGEGGLTFYLNGGSGTLIAGGGNNVVAAGPNAPATGGSWTLLFDGGNNTVYGTVGSLFVDDGSSSAAGNNLLYLGSGHDTVQSWGIDAIVAAPGGDALIATFHSGTAVYGNTGPSEVYNSGGDDTVVQGGGPETVYAQASGGLYFGGAGQLTFLSGANVDSTVVAGQGSAVMYGAPGSTGLFFVGPGQFMLDGGSGSQTVVGAAGLSSGALMFAENGGSLTLLGDSNGNLLVAGGGNATLNAGAASGSNALFAGTGNDELVAGTGSDFLVGGPGTDTLAGGAGTSLFEVDGAFAAGGRELIGNWNANDQLYLLGYGAPGSNGLPAGTAITVVNGSEVMVLPDGTSITFLGVSNVSTAQIHSS